MRISLNWLRELVEVTLEPEALAKILTMAGFEVEGIEDQRQAAEGVVVGKIVACQPHPNADKLRVCQVDIGAAQLAQIVCGAPNARTDILVPVATLGTYLPAVELKIRQSKLRGVSSEGMICSLAELGLAKESSGIHIFPQDDLKPGQDVRPLLGLDDVILDLSATANRADALTMVGVAREVAALTGAKLNLPQTPVISLGRMDGSLGVKITEEKACTAYIGTAIAAVKIAPSPDWLQWRLTAAGVRPINNVVDATNYILLEWGQPLHAFDLQRLQQVAGGDNLMLGVRFAGNNESLKTLDGKNRQLNSQNLLITANDRPVALAGVMGGEETEVYEGTTNIVLEAALFDPVVIRRSSRSQSIRTEASVRYERGVNQVELEIACSRAIALIIELAGGTVVTQAVADVRSGKWSNSILLRLERLHQVLGLVKQGDTMTQVPPAAVERILTDLGCKLEAMEGKSQVWNVTIPPYRYRDLEREIDLIEEVARLYGYDNFCDKLPDQTEPGYLSFEEAWKRKVRAAFRAVGLTEVVQYSLVKPTGAEIELANPLLSEYSALRTNLIAGLIDAFAYNQSQGNGALNAFEIGSVFWREAGEEKEVEQVAGIMGGELEPTGRWTRGGKESPLTWYEAKGMIESVFNSWGLTVEYQAEQGDDRLHPGRTAALYLKGKPLGIFGQLHPQLRRERDLPEAVYVFQMSFDVLLSSLGQDEVKRFKPYSTYPAVERDLAFFAPSKVAVKDITKAIKKAGGDLLAGVELFDEYQGKNVPAGERSLAFSLLYRAGDRTLTDQDVEPVHNKIRESLAEQFMVTLRS
ncbi:MAG: phenylalanine--tRNA ligase subunit beta [Gomphosphaeria aponina SAG 52.96 = DSM 107014]|uniref:Phenylalanine--tRNA ligase beta subunit n=1 Tax=Gomphosphaeria aponina SAG 52.96 = DSM 107014 TaxID=1521640 RepID=A0A941GV06_9CHRO|nr:phenylalanine--tRNA ligase subunit beta [Gomphosphaeria aponina SAG 52.96 = DSM 107014]